MSLPPQINDIILAHHDGFLYDLFGEGLGLPMERVAELRAMGVIPEVPAPALARAGIGALATRPLMMAILMGAAKQQMEPGRRKQADRWPAKKWSKQILRDAPSVSSPTPTPPSVTPIGGDTPDLPPPPPPPTGAGGGGPKPPEPPDFLTDLQKHSWTQARERAGSFVRGLGNIVTVEAETALAEVWNGEQIEREADADRRSEMVDIIREETAAATANNSKWRSDTAQKLASRLGNRTGDWSRNWERIARTEMQGAYNEGSVLEAIEWDGPDALIARIPEPSACADCRRVHLTRDGRPRVFKASDLINNGTNVGRKRTEWQATIWPIHPNCRCDTQHIPAGMEFDDEWGLVYKAHSFSQLARLAKGKGVKPEEEDEWARAKAQAKKQGQVKNYAYIMAIFKQMTGTAKGYLYKAGPFIGPRGGKWADAKHTVPWKESSIKGFKYAEKLEEWAKKQGFKTASEFASADLGRVGAKGVSHVAAYMDRESRGRLNKKAVTENLSESGNWYFLHVIDVDKADPGTHGKVTPTGKEDLSKPIVVNHKGEVLDGRHRVELARKRGIGQLKVYMPASLYFDTEIKDEVSKAGPFIGPRGGKWADAKHTIAWKEKSKRQLKREASEKRKKARASAEGPAVEAYNKAVKDHNEHDDAGYDANASDMADVAYGGYAPAKIDAMKVWAKKVGLEVGETDFSGGASYGSAYIQLKVPGIGAVGGSGWLDRAVVVRMSDHGNMARVAGGRLQTDTNIAPDFGWTFMEGIGHAIGTLRERFQEHLDNADDDDYFDQDPDGDAERKRMEEAMPLLDKLGKLYRKPG